MDGPRHGECLHELIDSVAAIELDAIAIEFHNDTVTYKELLSQAGRLAKHLHSLGAGPDVLVGVCVERSIDLIITLLAVLKSGAAYIPLDPHYPQDRIRTILSDAGASILITQSQFDLPEINGNCRVVLLDHGIPETDALYSCPDVRPEHLAYVIYTSGSTGKPKGVQITHAGAVNFLRSMQHEPGLTRDDIMVASTTVSFDISVLEIFLPLLTGARIRLVGHAAARDAQLLMPLLTTATMMQATPATWRMLLAAGWSGQKDLKILCGGEAMTRDLAVELRQRCASLWNMYGPTETTVWSSLYEVSGTPQDEDRIIPIGRPIANTQLWIMDKDNRPVSDGETGELCIGGAGLARGYLNRPDLTAERFVETAYGRLYRTGDLARSRPDGNLVYLGRTDHQVKVRGFRIELGEIEAALMDHARVSAAAVLAVEEDLGDKRLDAYVERTSAVTGRELRTHLQRSLPDYMIPGIFRFVETMPLTPNGKIDRKALPACAGISTESETEYTAAQTPTEERLVRIWQDILQRSGIGIHDNFFELGGHSLSATRLISRIKEEFGATLSFQQFFDGPTVHAQAGIIEGHQEPAGQVMPAIRPRSESGRCPLSFAQQRLWYMDQLDGNGNAFNMVEARRLSGPLNADLLQKALNAVVQRHAILRTAYPEENGIPYQQVQGNRQADWRYMDLRGRPSEEQDHAVQKAAVEEARHHFDLINDVLLRVLLVRTGDEEYIFLTNMQHSVSDEWSMGIFYQELGVAYAALSRGESPAWPALRLQYADYAAWQQEWLTEDLVEERMGYWRRQLQDAPVFLDLAPDRPRQVPRTAHGAHERFMLDETMTRQLTEFSVRNGVTLFMTLWTAFAMLISRRARQEDIVIATTLANRSHPEVEPLIGFFINVLPLRVSMTGEAGLLDILQRVRQTALEAYREQDMPLDKIVEKLHLSRGDLNALPLSQVAFNFQNGLLADPDFHGITVESVDLETNQAGTELALLISEGPSGLKAVIEYRTDLFTRDTVRELGGQFQRILQAILDLEQPTLSDIGLAAGLAHSESEAAGRDSYFRAYLKRTNLTGNQLLVWLGQQLNPEDPIYNSVITYTLRENIDPGYFQAAFQKVVDCRDSLRTSIRVENGVPRQEVQESAVAEVIYLDMTERPDPDAAVTQWIQQRVNTAFDLNGPLYCCALLKAGPQKYVWCMAQHHIITDGWSHSLLYHDMHRFYRQAVEGRADDGAAKVTYQEFVTAEREWRSSARQAKAAAYWQEQLTQAPEPLRFFGQRPRKETSRVQRRSLALGTELSAQVIAAARAVNPSAKSLEAAKFNVFLTLYALFIAHICGQREFTIGIPLHNRRSKQFKDVTGLIMQVVPVRVTVLEEDTLQTLLQRISRTVMKAMQHGQYVLRNPDQDPLYDAVLNYHMWNGPNFYTRPAEVEWVHPGHAQESLSLQVHDFECGMEGSAVNIHIDLDFHADVFDAGLQTIALENFQHIVREYAADTQRPLNRIPLLTAQDHSLLTDTVNATSRELPPMLLQQLIEEQARRRPAAVAVEDGETRMTYEQLDKRANQLARYLQAQGVKPEQPVGLLLERCPDMIVSLLAVLKAGGCYLPLDPKSPPERLKSIVDDVLTPDAPEVLVLTRRAQASLLPQGAVKRLCLDDPDMTWEDHPVTAPPCPAGPRNLAYIIYTSGSTGKPKGVMIEHRSIVNYVLYSVDRYEMQDSDRVLQFSSITFDAAAEEIYPVLAAGGTLVLRDEETIRTPQTFIEKCNRHGVTLLSMPTAYFHQLTAAAAGDGPRFGRQLRMILFGGERVFPQEIRRWQQAYADGPRLVNTYGPTEATVVATTHFLTDNCGQADPSGEIPIGRPVHNTHIYVLNKNGQPVGTGIPGELAIGGAGVARGYVNRPELTAQRFVPDPLKPDGDPVYLTGDLVRLSPDGRLEFLGRVDDQVKVRGYRIELGEIENALKDHPRIIECAVLAPAGDGTDRRLEAYFSASTGAEELADPRGFLKDRLPEYMIPAQFYRIDSFPVTSQGKIDRRALPFLGGEAVSAARPYVAPTTETEKRLSLIWAEVLQTEKIGIDDNFFDLGGHSLLATQIISRVQQTFHVELSLRSLFEDPTIKALAAVIGQQKEKSPAGPMIKRISRDNYRVGVDAQGGLVEVKP